MASATLAPPPDRPTGPVRRFSVAEYHQMIEHGVLGPDDKVELLEGWIVPKMPKNPRHCFSLIALAELIRALLPKGWHIRTQDPITFADSEPEPDLVVVRGTNDDYCDRHPGPDDIGLIIEVARTSLGTDLKSKKRVYAANGIPVYWVMNTNKRMVEVFSHPASVGRKPAFAKNNKYIVGDAVPLRIAGKLLGELAVTKLVPAKAK